MIEIKPLPCPFCGHTKPNVFSSTYYRPMARVYVFCPSTRCDVQGPQRKTQRGAISAWNRRHEEKTDDAG